MNKVKGLDNIILALDQMTPAQINTFLKQTPDTFHTVKIGLELFCGHGIELIKKIHGDFGVNIFLDLKLHDIPNTVEKAIQSLLGLPIHFLTIHMSGGEEMIKRSLIESFISLPLCKILGVSFLTSLGENDFKDIFSIDLNSSSPYETLFKLGIKCKVPGIVLSAHELPQLTALEAQMNTELIKICPGIRFKEEIESGHIQDQKRALTPEMAMTLGANYLVIGRSLTTANRQLLEKRINTLQSLRNTP